MRRDVSFIAYEEDLISTFQFWLLSGATSQRGNKCAHPINYIPFSKFHLWPFTR